MPCDKLPSPEDVDAVLSSVLRLPPSLTASALDLEVPECWRVHPWLRNQRLLRLTAEGEAELGHDRVRYTETLGLEVVARGR